MRFVVYGSLLYKCCPVDKLKAASRSLGAALAARGHTVVVGSDSPNTVDLYIVQGVNDVNGTHEVIVDRPASVESSDPEESRREYPFANGTDYKNVKFRHKLRTGPWYVTHFQGMADADCVIVLGGAGGTAAAGLSASALRKPVVAIPAFHGAAEQVWLEVSRYYDECGISEELQNSLRMWDPKSGTNAVTIAERLGRNSPFTRNRIPFYASLGCLIALIVFWFLFLLQIFGPLRDWKVTLMLSIASVLGSGLRVLVNLRSDLPQTINGKQIAIDLVASLTICVALVILYFLGGLAYVGTPSFFNNAEPDKLRTAALYVSLIGFSAGFLLEKTLAAVEKELAGIPASISLRRN